MTKLGSNDVHEPQLGISTDKISPLIASEAEAWTSTRNKTFKCRDEGRSILTGDDLEVYSFGTEANKDNKMSFIGHILGNGTFLVIRPSVIDT